MAVWRRWSARGGSPRDARAAPSDLRLHLPLLWPDGPDRPLDDAALRALSEEYARTGRGVEELLADLDQLCAVLGISAPGRMIETSSVAWADAFLDTVADPAAEATGSLAEVERRVTRPTAGAWQGVAPEVRLLVVSWALEGSPDRGAAVATRVVAEVRAVFPGAAVAAQAPDRVLAAVPADEDLGPRTEELRSRCSELVTTGRANVEVVPGPIGADLTRRFFRRAG